MLPKVTPILLTLVLTALISSMPVLAAGGRGATSAPVPLITSVSEGTPGQITIRGQAFGAESPVVFLGNHRLAVKQNGENEIVAHLPDNVPPATYSLLLVRNKSVQSLPFSFFVRNN